MYFPLLVHIGSTPDIHNIPCFFFCWRRMPQSCRMSLHSRNLRSSHASVRWGSRQFFLVGLKCGKSLQTLSLAHAAPVLRLPLTISCHQLGVPAGNSFGIFPVQVREAVSKQVLNLMTDDGVFIVGFWCAAGLRDC